MEAPPTDQLSDEWQARFEARAGQHAAVQQVDVSGVDRRVLPTLAASVAVFQLGESGTGEHLLAAARHARADDAYVDALVRFVEEEQEHARMLAVVLDACRWPLRTSHWSDRVFVLIRRAHSLRTEVLVLMVAETIALTYYGALRDGLSVPSLRDAFGRIHDDEVVHVDFHCQTLPPHLQRFPGWLHAVARMVWVVLVTGATAAVAVSHGRALRAMGVSRRTFCRRVAEDRRAVAARLFATS